MSAFARQIHDLRGEKPFGPAIARRAADYQNFSPILPAAGRGGELNQRVGGRTRFGPTPHCWSYLDKY